MSGVSERRACQVLEVARATVRAQPRRQRRAPVIADPLATQLHALIQQHPTFGYRHLWALLRGQGLRVNRKAVYRVFVVLP